VTIAELALSGGLTFFDDALKKRFFLGRSLLLHGRQFGQCSCEKEGKHGFGKNQEERERLIKLSTFLRKRLSKVLLLVQNILPEGCLKT
jgi:hypothetical protein